MFTQVLAKGDIETVEPTAVPAPAPANPATPAAPIAAAAASAAPAPAAASFEVGGADPASRARALFSWLDLNGNGTVSLAELAVYFGDGAAEIVAEMDTIQKDGAISLEEWESFFAALEADVAPAYLGQLEQIILSKNLADAAPPPEGQHLAGEEPTAEPAVEPTTEPTEP